MLASQERLLGDVTDSLGTPEPSFSDAFADERAPFAGIQSLSFVQGMSSEHVKARQISNLEWVKTDLQKCFVWRPSNSGMG